MVDHVLTMEAKWERVTQDKRRGARMAEQNYASTQMNMAAKVASLWWRYNFVVLHIFSNGDQNHSNSPLIAWFPIGLSLERSGAWGACGLWQPQQMVLDQILESGQWGRLAMKIVPCLGDNNPVWTSGSSSGSSARRIALCPSQTAGTLEQWQTAVLKPCDNLGKPNSETCFLL